MTDIQPFAVDQAAVARYLGLDPRDPKAHAVVAVCERYHLDPILKHVIVLPKGGAYITRDGYLHVAHNSGNLDGIVLEETGSDPEEWWAVVAVYRKDMGHPFKYRGRYSKSGNNRLYGPEMAIKNAEAMCLRRAFDVAGLPAEDEHPGPARSAPPPIPTAPAPSSHAPPAVPPSPPTTVTVTTDTGPEPVDVDTGEIVDADVVEDVSDEDRDFIRDHATIPKDRHLVASAAQLKKIHAACRGLGYTERADVLRLISLALGEDIASSKDLTKDTASTVIDALEALEATDDPQAAIDALAGAA